MERWRARDPLTLTRSWLAEHYDCREQALDEVAESVQRQLEELERAAVAAPFPDPGEPASEFKAASVA